METPGDPGGEMVEEASDLEEEAEEEVGSGFSWALSILIDFLSILRGSSSDQRM